MQSASSHTLNICTLYTSDVHQLTFLPCCYYHFGNEQSTLCLCQSLPQELPSPSLHEVLCTE